MAALRGDLNTGISIDFELIVVPTPAHSCACRPISIPEDCKSMTYLAARENGYISLSLSCQYRNCCVNKCLLWHDAWMRPREAHSASEFRIQGPRPREHLAASLFALLGNRRDLSEAAIYAPRSLESMKFPVKSLLTGKSDFRDGFALDCLLQRRVSCET